MKRFYLIMCSALISLSANATSVRFNTTKGNFDVTLNCTKAPISCKNFLSYVKDGSYNGTIFHRVIKDFMIQGGGYTAQGTQRPSHDPIKNESDNGLSNVTGTIAMARTSDPDSATRQFYINVHDNPFLDGQPGKPGYAVFGHVTQGMKVVQAISHVPTGMSPTLGMPNSPVTPVIIQSVTLIKD
ncbi:peptidylprolyl isomerase [Celerinatantimonas yamalensis]|uniref:Peptidyl-prolyl cis-trans isomerase n=1 Tax=Celerinatantimonas yamalensis TaxID=559956 RepID=A0ABW9GCG7_9GAMM